MSRICRFFFYFRVHRFISAQLPMGISLLILGCLPQESDQVVDIIETATTVAQVDPSTTAKAAKIIFKASNPSGSFNSAGSTAPGPGAGAQAVRIFNADGTLMATDGPSNTSWPPWIDLVEIGISGTNNTSATQANCARFAESATDGAALCDFDLDGTFDTPCGAPESFYRVSEVDCSAGTMNEGNGGPNDGVYIRVHFDRTQLAERENIMAVLEYSASVINPPPQDPKKCFKEGRFEIDTPGCADMVWRTFLKRKSTDTVQPFLLLVPPALGYVQTSSDRSGTGIQTKKLILPLASDQQLQVLQFSRIRALTNSATNFTSICASNSAHCVGMVFHALTLYRI